MTDFITRSSSRLVNFLAFDHLVGTTARGVPYRLVFLSKFV